MAATVFIRRRRVEKCCLSAIGVGPALLVAGFQTSRIQTHRDRPFHKIVLAFFPADRQIGWLSRGLTSRIISFSAHVRNYCGWWLSRRSGETRKRQPRRSNRQADFNAGGDCLLRRSIRSCSHRGTCLYRVGPAAARKVLAIARRPHIWSRLFQGVYVQFVETFRAAQQWQPPAWPDYSRAFTQCFQLTRQQGASTGFGANLPTPGRGLRRELSGARRPSRKISQSAALLFGQGFVVFLFAFVEAHFLEQHHVAVGQV